jgi:asparagine synthase (glutamine-hydrolysing)
MCGIAGFWNPAFRAEAAPQVVTGMLGLVSHRGPDEHGYYFDDSAALAVARLAVLDRAGGRQPFTDAGRRYWLAYNGEVYNYRELRQELGSHGRCFHTRSDTEVVLAAWLQWGDAAFGRFDGGFAVAIYDRLERRLTLARDRWGKRPLFYTTIDGALVFASEMKAFLAYPGAQFRWDSSQLSSLFTLWTTLPGTTPFVGIHQVPPGATLAFGHQGTGGTRPARIELAGEAFDRSREEAEEALREVLAESVRQRLHSDVGVGVYLSGGIDSAIVALLAAGHLSQPLNTFSVTFEDSHCDESADQQRLSTLFQTRHTTVPVRSADLVRALPASVVAAEVPLFRAAPVPMFLLSQQVRCAGLEVVLTGEGADECFLGYDLFKEALIRDRWDELDENARRDALGHLYRDQPHFRPDRPSAFAGVLLAHRQGDDPDLFSHLPRFTSGRFAQRLLKEPGDGLAPLRRWIAGHRAELDRLDMMRRAQWLEITTLLAGYLLSSQGDRMAFAHGVENRCPFLDPAVMALAARLPVDWRLQGLMGDKAILRRAFASQLPGWLLEKPKRPYVSPDAAMVAGPFARACLDGCLAPEELERIDVVDGGFARALAERLAGSPASAISPRESRAFLLLVSLAILDRTFVRRDAARPAPRGTLTVAEDGRRLPVPC